MKIQELLSFFGDAVRKVFLRLWKGVKQLFIDIVVTIVCILYLIFILIYLLITFPVWKLLYLISTIPPRFSFRTHFHTITIYQRNRLRQRALKLSEKIAGWPLKPFERVVIAFTPWE